MRTNYFKELKKDSSSEEEHNYAKNTVTTSIPQKRRKVENIEKPEEDRKPIPSSKTTEKKYIEDDRWEVYGKSICYQMKDLNDHQQVICQKLISDAIFCAKLNKLNENSHIVTPLDEN